MKKSTDTPEQANSASDIPTNDRFLTTQELMKFLNLSRTKIWELVKNQGLPAFKIGADYRYRLSEVLDWMESRRITKE